ncbi:transmembrane protein 39A isoform X1 [Gadus morhua]|uniref:transmembrane protein 39A isoform X1 n=1 Tax=Gadus morhua TaxID=8049 RepID=UPI0011B460C3|nr:transmembrane protein 39A isoform X1 [Gadus morhua]XP_030232563.1 transmembrane protein 39A isoform X1 [Gadus morhua]XP_030232564.1 transmembrane protein 39A isoform X1 [Gadus morhua]XP_030232565.1 transmembrane protein 39A isoform X1 [Gadus morhua]
MPGGRRGPSRQQLSRSALPSLQTLVGGNLSNGTGFRNRSSNSVGLSAPPLSALITPEPVRHSKIPELPLDSSLVFEFLLFLYLLVALFVQYMNIYRTVWWYPYSQPAASTSLNFHLMDYHLATFITVMLARRLVWTIVSEVSQRGGSSLVRSGLLITARLCLLTLCGWVLCWTLVNLCRNHSVLNLLFLGYPFGVYIPLCCFHQEGAARSQAAAAASVCGYHGDQGQQGDLVAAAAEAPFFRPRDFLFLLRENLREQFTSPPQAPTHTCHTHTHTHTPELIRGEVEELKSDFNRRIKEVLFNSLFSAYYVAFLPLCFVKSTQYYDMRWSCEHLIMVWINAFVMLMSQLLPPSYCDLLHRSAAHLGRWQKLEHGSYSNAPQHVWSESTIWPQGVLVRHSRSLYKAVGTYNVALPSDISHSRFYFLFHKPLRILNLLIWIESTVVLYQLYSLLRSERWNHTLSLGLILFCNYYVLFKLLRDRIVLGKAYSYPSSPAAPSSSSSSSSSSSNGLGLKSQ